jgi:hypothetical protein
LNWLICNGFDTDSFARYLSGRLTKVLRVLTLNFLRTQAFLAQFYAHISAPISELRPRYVFLAFRAFKRSLTRVTHVSRTRFCHIADSLQCELFHIKQVESLGNLPCLLPKNGAGVSFDFFSSKLFSEKMLQLFR